MKRIKKLIFLIIAGIAVSSCAYDFIKEDTTPIDPNAQVSFSQQILPIFNNNNNCTSCHKPGQTSPDYTAANAYSSIMNNNVVNTAAPASSPLYTIPAPTTSTHTWKKYTATQAQLILLWIQQGAKNN
jgi:hypothetical protein